LFIPQVHTVPSLLNATVWNHPLETLFQLAQVATVGVEAVGTVVTDCPDGGPRAYAVLAATVNVYVAPLVSPEMTNEAVGLPVATLGWTTPFR
jgi:hypothetical protein